MTYRAIAACTRIATESRMELAAPVVAMGIACGGDKPTSASLGGCGRRQV